MTEETLQAAILKLQSIAMTQYATIKDLYHRPVQKDTVDKIAQHALHLANAEGAMITLKQYAKQLAQQTDAEEVSNTPEQPTEVEVEEDNGPITEEYLQKHSKTFRRSQEHTNNSENEPNES